MSNPTPATDQVLAEQADKFTAMLVANHALGHIGTLDVLTRGLADRPDLVPSVVHRLLNLTTSTGGDQ